MVLFVAPGVVVCSGRPSAGLADARGEGALSPTTIRSLVRTHGQIIRQAEQAEAAALLQRDDLETLRPQLMPVTEPRRRAGWPKELSAAVDLALAAGAERPPQGIRQADWDRVLDARRQEASLTREELRHLGPSLEPAQVLLTIDAVLTRTPQAHQFGEIRTARIATAEGTRCLSGTGEVFLQTLRVLARPECRAGTLPPAARRWRPLDPHLLSQHGCRLSPPQP